MPVDNIYSNGYHFLNWRIMNQFIFSYEFCIYLGELEMNASNSAYKIRNSGWKISYSSFRKFQQYQTQYFVIRLALCRIDQCCSSSTKILRFSSWIEQALDQCSIHVWTVFSVDWHYIWSPTFTDRICVNTSVERTIAKHSMNTFRSRLPLLLSMTNPVHNQICRLTLYL